MAGIRGDTGDIEWATKISSYILYYDDGIIYKDRMTVEIGDFEGTPFNHYYFTDETSDTCYMLGLRSGSHYVDYNSDKPNIVKVQCNHSLPNAIERK